MKLKVAILVDSLAAGGVQNTAIEEAYYLNKLGYNTKILSLSKRDFKKDVIIKKVEYEFLENRYPKFLKVNFKFPIFHFFSFTHLISPLIAPFKIKRGEFDLIITHNTISGLTALTINKISHIPYFLTVHDPALFILKKIYKKSPLGSLFPIILPLIKFIEKIIFKNASLVFTDSAVYKNSLLKNYSVRSKTLYLGMETQKNPVLLGQNFISLSRWDFGKNPNLILDLAEQLKNRRFTIAGKWTREKEFKSFSLEIKNRKLKNLILEPNTDKLSKKELFENKLAFIHPHFEAFGLGAFEAASFGLPVVMPKNSGVTEILKTNHKEIYPASASSKKLLVSLRFLINNPDAAQQIAKSNFEKTQIYSWQHHADLLSSYITESKTRSINTSILETGHINLQFLAGGDIILQKLIESLANKLKVTIITTKFGALHWRKNIQKIEIRILNQVKDKSRNSFGIFIIYIKRCINCFTLLKRTKPQLIISTTDIFPDVLPAFFYKLTDRKTNWVAWIHHLIPSPNIRKGSLVINLISYISQLVSLIAIRISADIIICRNSTIYHHLKKSGFNAKKLRIIDTGVEFDKFNSHSIGKKYNYDGVFIGRLNLLKGILDIPDIWQKVSLQLPKAKLAIIGSTNTKEAPLLLKKLTAMKLKNNVKIIGAVPEATLMDILKCSKVFLMTDYEAGFSLATSEAMAAGTPVVAYNLPIFGTIYNKGYLGTRVGDTAQMAETIVRLLKNPSLRKKLSYEGIGEAKKLDISKTVQAFEKIINEIN